MTATIDAMHDPSAPEQSDSMLVMFVAYGWECEPPMAVALPTGEVSKRVFSKDSYTAYVGGAGTAAPLLQIHQIGRNGQMRKIFRFNLRKLTQLNACLLAIYQEVVS
jgi:hypothetical protein